MPTFIIIVVIVNNHGYCYYSNNHNNSHFFHPSENSIKNEPPRKVVYIKIFQSSSSGCHIGEGEREGAGRKRQRQRSVKQEREIYHILLKIWIEKKTNHTCVKKRRKTTFSLWVKGTERYNPSTFTSYNDFLQGKIPRRLELVVSSKWKTLAIPKMYVLLKLQNS